MGTSRLFHDEDIIVGLRSHIKVYHPTLLKLFDEQCLLVQELRTEKRKKNAEDEALKRDKTSKQMKFAKATEGNMLTLLKPSQSQEPEVYYGF